MRVATPRPRQKVAMRRGGLTDWVIFEHAHGEGRPGTGEGVEETGRGHGNQAHNHGAGLGCAPAVSN